MPLMMAGGSVFFNHLEQGGGEAFDSRCPGKVAVIEGETLISRRLYLETGGPPVMPARVDSAKISFE